MGEIINETQTEEVIPEFYNRHYIVVDDQNRIVDGWSDGPRPDRDTSDAICINEQGGYQFRLFPSGEENPALYDWDNMIPLYKFEDGRVLQRTAEEIEADRASVPDETPVPDAQADTDALLIDHELRLTLLELGLSGEVN